MKTSELLRHKRANRHYTIHFFYNHQASYLESSPFENVP